MNKHDWIVAALVVILIFIPLAIPYKFQMGNWALTSLAWIGYILIAAILSILVFRLFLRSWRQLSSEGEKEDENE